MENTLNKNPILKEDFNNQRYLKVLKKPELLKRLFTESLLNKLVKYMKERIYNPDEILYNNFEKSNELYFIVSGQI